MNLPDYLQPWAERLASGWPIEAGTIPDADAVRKALELGAQPGAAYSLAWAMYCRQNGATRGEVIAACGGMQFNRAREAQRQGRADFMIAQRADGSSAYFLGPTGSRPGGPTAVPAGRDEPADEDFTGIQKPWQRIRLKASLPDVRIHDLRHCFASTAVAHGESLYLVGAVLGHRTTSTTQRYAHLAMQPILDSANRTSARLAALMQNARHGDTA
jgi:hypothetical protein